MATSAYILVQERVLVILAEEVRGYVGEAWRWNHGLVVSLEDDKSSNVEILYIAAPDHLVRRRKKMFFFKSLR